MEKTDKTIKKAIISETLRDLLNSADHYFQSPVEKRGIEEILAEHLCIIVLKESFQVEADQQDITNSRIDLNLVAEKIQDVIGDYLHREMPLDNKGILHISKKETWEVA